MNRVEIRNNKENITTETVGAKSRPLEFVIEGMDCGDCALTIEGREVRANTVAIANETIHERMVEWRIALVSKVSQWLSLDSTEAELIYNQSYKRSNKMSWEVAEYHQHSS